MFFKKKEKTIDAPVYVPGTEIPYKPDLINNLKNDHVELVQVCDEWSPQRYLEFGEEYRAVGDALTRRIESEEESLYSLYLPPIAYRT